MKKTDQIVLGADSVIDLDGELISKPENREKAIKILDQHLFEALNQIMKEFSYQQDLVMWASFTLLINHWA